MTEEQTLKNNFKRDWPKLSLNWAIIAFFFLLPWQTRYIFREAPLYEWGTMSVYGIEILGWIIIILFAFSHRQKFSISPASPRQSRGRANFQFPILGLILLAFLSTLWAPDGLIALQAAMRLTEGVLLFVIIVLVVNNKSQAPNHKQIQNSNEQNPKRLKFRICNLFGICDLEFGIYAAAFIVGAVIQALLGTYQFLTQSSFASTILGMALHDPRALGTVVVEFADQRWLRAYGSLPHPNVLGGYLVIALAALVLGIRNYELGIRRCVWWGSVFILLTGIFFTFSRSAWIVMGLIFISMFICRRKHFLPIGKKCFLIGYVVFLIILFRPLVAARVMPVTTERLEIKSRVERVEGLKESWTLIKKYPLLGVGIGNYTQSVQRDIRPGDPLYSYQPVHNVFLLIWAELGVVGLILFLLALYKIIKQSSCYVLCVMCVVLMMFDHYLWSLPFGVLLFWGILGLSTIGLKNQGLDPAP